MNQEIMKKFIQNDNILRSEIELMLKLKIPFCLYGEVGKTNFISINIKDIIILDTRELLDIKNLVGFYAIDRGDVIYNEGILVTAMTKGHNVLIKNIDQNLNLLYFLSMLIKHRQIVNNKGQLISACEKFNIMFTAKERFKIDDVYFIGPIEYKWNVNTDCIKKIELILSKIVSLINSNTIQPCLHKKNKDCLEICLTYSSCHNGFSTCISKDRALCKFHYKKICQLIDFVSKTQYNTYEDRLCMYDLVTNLFLCHDSMACLALFNINYFPDVIVYDINVVKTFAYKLAIRNVLSNIRRKKYSLLVGETGVGKTALIQYISSFSEKYLGYKSTLKIVNMSSDYDMYDLIGGYSAFDVAKKITELYCKYKIAKPKSLDNMYNIEYLKAIVNDPELDCLKKCVQNKINITWRDGILAEAMKNGYWVLLDEINLCNEETLGAIDSIISKTEVCTFEKNNYENIQIHSNFMLFACMNPANDFGKKNFTSENFNFVNFFDFTDNIEDTKSVIRNYLGDVFKSETIDKLARLIYKIRQMIRTKELTNKIEPLISGRTLIRCMKALKNCEDSKVMDIFSVFILTQFDIPSRSIVNTMFCELFEPIKYKIVATYNDNEYVLTPELQMILHDIKTAIILNSPILLQGDTSTGKTSLIYYLAAKLNHKIIRFNNHEHTEANDYFGNYISVNQTIEFKESAFIKAVRNGYWVILDELNLAQSEVLEVLNRLLDDNKEILLPQKNEMIKAHPNFRLFATQNLEYSGRKSISKAFRNRFVEIFFSEKTDSEVLEILQLQTKMPKSFCSHMVKVYCNLKKQRNIDSFITLRDLFRWAKRVPRTLYEVYETGLSVIYERQRNDCDKSKVLNIFNDVFCKVNEQICDYTENEFFNTDNETIRKYEESIVVTDSVLKTIKLINAAIKCREPILLVGETGTGKTKICEVIAKFYSRKFSFLNMHSGIENSDFTGSFTLKNRVIEWQNGPLTEAVINGDAFLIDEINLAEDSVLERFNSLLEDKREFFIPEIDKNIKAHEDLIIFATMNPGNDFGKRELSCALRNRFTEIYINVNTGDKIAIFESMLYNNNIAKPAFFDKIINNVYSLRSLELFCEFLKCYKSNDNSYIKIKDNDENFEAIQEAFSFAFEKHEKSSKIAFKETSTDLTLDTYVIYKTKETVFDFENETTLKNLKKLLRALIVKRGILLEGEPGVGKTSIVTNLAKMLNKKCIRINLSEQTELSDLVGTYLPVDDTIKFVQSQLSLALKNGWWIILDEINLCSQSVIEGLNSVLDYRKKLILPNNTINVHPDTKIFATMNPCNSSNGRKILPKSFLDRFVAIYMSTYTETDVKKILKKLFGNYKYHKNCSLRENIQKNTFVPTIGDIEYNISCSSINIGKINIPIDRQQNNLEGSLCKLDSSYVLIHDQLKQLETILAGLIYTMPVIITGGIGKTSLVQFLSVVLNIPCFMFMCHKDIDINDIVGQYHKEINGMFAWKNSPFIDSIIKGTLVVLQNPELIEKSIFDRCNALFESDRTFNVYEKGTDTDITVNTKTKFIMFVDNILDLSPALRDRCLVVSLSNKLSRIDLWKMFFKSKEIYTDFFCKNYDHMQGNNKILKTPEMNFFDWFPNEFIETDDLFIYLKKFMHLYEFPCFFKKKLSNVYNEIFEENINAMFCYHEKKPDFDDKNLEFVSFYESINYNIEVGSNDIERLLCIEKAGKENEIHKILTFVKNCNLDIFDIDNFAKNWCHNLPMSIQECKEYFLHCLQYKTLGDISFLQKLSDIFVDINYGFSLEPDFAFIDIIENCECDPIEIYKKYIMYKKNVQENEIMKKIHKNIILRYKYGRGDVEELIKTLNTINEKYIVDIQNINKKANRDWLQFKSKYAYTDLCRYYTDSNIRSLFDKFDDLTNYYLLYLFKLRKKTEGCLGICKGLLQPVNTVRKHFESDFVFESKDKVTSYKSLVGNFLFNKDLPNNFISNFYGEYGHYLCKYIYCVRNSSSFDISELILEACLKQNQVIDMHINNNNCIPGKYINECLNFVFKKTEVAFILDFRCQSVSFDNSIIKFLDTKMINLPLFTLPELLETHLREFIETNGLHSVMSNDILLHKKFDDEVSDFCINENILLKNVHTAYKKIVKYFKTPESMSWQCNYKYFMFLEFNKFNFELAERFFMDCQVYEFYDRMYFATIKARKDNNNTFYNIVLQYKAFDIEEHVDKKISEAKTKLRKEPKQCFKTRQELRKFLLLPVTNVIDLKFVKPQCYCKDIQIDAAILRFVDMNNDECLCEKFYSLSQNFDRSKISAICKNLHEQNNLKKLSKQETINLFYSRTVCDKFSYSEICVAKVINKITEDMSHLLLIQLAFKNPFVPFLFFVFNFADETDISYEDGTGIKKGTGEKNISDKIEDESEISNEMCDENAAEEDDGIDLENEGKMSSTEEEAEKNEVGVDGDDNKNEELVDEEQEESSESSKYEFEENEGCGESSGSFNDGVHESDEASEVLTEDETNEPVNASENPCFEEKNDIMTDYKYKEGKMNVNQTCDEALNYETKVFGSNQENALCSGDGNHEVDGNKNEGNKTHSECAVSFNFKETLSEKLLYMLKNVLQHNKMNKYQGDYKSGKKLNMKKLITYIASDFRKDKIWMRRRKSDKKEYIIRLFVDNSKSMYNKEMIETLYTVYSSLNNAFRILNIPVEVYKFGSAVQRCNITDMCFTDHETNIDWIEEYNDGINIVLTDGVFQKTGFYNDNFLIILIDKNDILNMSKVSITGGSMFIQKYLDIFSLKYCIVKNIDELESSFILALKEMIKKTLKT